MNSNVGGAIMVETLTFLLFGYYNFNGYNEG